MPDISNNILHHNLDGGIFASSPSGGNIANSNIYSNFTSDKGGGAYVTVDLINLTNNRIESNSAGKGEVFMYKLREY